MVVATEGMLSNIFYCHVSHISSLLTCFLALTVAAGQNKAGTAAPTLNTKRLDEETEVLSRKSPPPHDPSLQVSAIVNETCEHVNVSL